MTAARVRFAAAAGACAAWAGAIAWLAWTSANPAIVSAPQALSAEAVLRCRRGAEGQPWTVEAVRWRRAGVAAAALPKTLPAAEAAAPPPSRSGLWLIPAARRNGDWEVARIPVESLEQLAAGTPRRPIYPATPEVERQFDRLLPAPAP